MSQLLIKPVTTTKELEGILALQTANLRRHLNEEEAEAQGFVTAEYTMELLQQMHQEQPSIIAKDGELIAGYALVTLPSIRHQHELLGDLINTIDKISYKGIALRDAQYVVVGQLCVAKEYRGQGLVQQLYEGFRQALQHQFDYCITDVAEDNPRSLKAHLKTGFQVVDTLQYGGLKWHIVLWDWTLP